MTSVEPDWAGLFDDRHLSQHVFHGTKIPPKGITGMHYAPSGRPPPTCQTVRRDRPWKNGVYRARVYVKGDDGRYHAKRAVSTMFPDEWSRNEVLEAGKAALKDAWERGNIDENTGAWHGTTIGAWKSRLHVYHISGWVDTKDGTIKRVKSFYPTKRHALENGGREL